MKTLPGIIAFLLLSIASVAHASPVTITFSSQIERHPGFVPPSDAYPLGLDVVYTTTASVTFEYEPGAAGDSAVFLTTPSIHLQNRVLVNNEDITASFLLINGVSFSPTDWDVSRGESYIYGEDYRFDNGMLLFNFVGIRPDSYDPIINRPFRTPSAQIGPYASLARIDFVKDVGGAAANWYFDGGSPTIWNAPVIGTSVPEPSSALLFATGILALSARVARRRCSGRSRSPG